jgi:hypothetical protein
MRWPSIIFIAVMAAGAAAAQETSLRFFGNGVAAPQQDRVTIALDAPARPVDVGAGDFTIELWLKSAAGNASGACVSGGDGWIDGNIVLDRDVFGSGDAGDFGLSLFGAGGRLAFGVDAGGSGTTICGASDVADGAWHHVALTRRASDGQLRLFVDGQLDASGAGPSGDVSYRDGRATAYPSSDPFLVLGAEKHDAGAAYPSFHGWIDELRVSTAVRYAAAFAPPAAPFAADAATAALYHFDAAPGACTGVVADAASAAGGPSPGTCAHGGSPAGPFYSSDSPFAAPLPPLCGATPIASGCRAAASGLLMIKKDADASRDRLIWKWLRGAATDLADLGDPRDATDYALCIYNASSAPGALVASPRAAVGAGWRALGTTGFGFSLAAAPDGLARVGLKSGAAGRARALAKGRGSGLGLPAALPFGPAPAVVVQLVNRAGDCWSSSFSGASTSSGTLLKTRF